MRHYLLFFCVLICFQHFGQISDFEHISFEKADNIAKSHKGESLKNMPILVYKLTSKLHTDVEKFRAIYVWVCTNIESDYGNQLQNLRMRKKYENDSTALYEWNVKFREKALRKLIRQKRTICTGYAYLLKEMAILAGLDCKMIHGYGRNVTSNIGELTVPNHSWNVVKLNNKWYFADPTWASGYFNIDDGHFVWQYNDGYFFSEPELFAKSHYPLDKKWLLLENKKPTIPEFLNGPLVYGSSFKYGVLPISPSRMESEILKGEEIALEYRVPRQATLNKIGLHIVNSSEKKVFNYTYDASKELLKFTYLFKRRGVFDVHLVINNEVVSTHVFQVK
ncbi:transglutaminase domain-containing protein [Seonamhaeicola marinus]|uniref:Transglutaminase-like domain-containing protein n=1 Tax=Seonamhaeicola marinus TaxID=1912246 RepID=A0A5D0I4D0_9FLAO|nr:transglutaminase domain-containing protein [Seonamhaeicola marinus]TYA78524.1 hypothetical protein FUA24_09210 [Seonamhaeicola marinus]